MTNATDADEQPTIQGLLYEVIFQRLDRIEDALGIKGDVPANIELDALIAAEDAAAESLRRGVEQASRGEVRERDDFFGD